MAVFLKNTVYYNIKTSFYKPEQKLNINQK